MGRPSLSAHPAALPDSHAASTARVISSPNSLLSSWSMLYQRPSRPCCWGTETHARCPGCWTTRQPRMVPKPGNSTSAMARRLPHPVTGCTADTTKAFVFFSGRWYILVTGVAFVSSGFRPSPDPGIPILCMFSPSCAGRYEPPGATGGFSLCASLFPVRVVRQARYPFRFGYRYQAPLAEAYFSDLTCLNPCVNRWTADPQKLRELLGGYGCWLHDD